MSQEKLTAEIMYLSALINAKTELCVFTNFSGHVAAFQVRIAESREKCKLESELFSHYSYLDKEDSDEHLRIIRDVLGEILMEHNVTYDKLLFVSLQEIVSAAKVGSPDLEDRMIGLETEMSDLKVLVSELLEERGAADVSEELPSSRGDRHANGDRLEDRLQEALLIGERA